MSSLKQRFEDNAVIFCASLAIAAFIAGFGARSYFMPSQQIAPANCTIEGLASLEQGHTQRLAALQNSLATLESSASDRTLLSSTQETYKASADRVRKDIAAENTSYQTAINALSIKCTDA